MTTNVLKRLPRVHELSTLPVVVNNVMQITQNPRSSAMEVGQAISQDQTLAANVLKMVNSAFYGFPQKISTITHAIVILGFNNIRNIVLTTSVFKMFAASKSESRFDVEGFWKHSLACGVASRVLARRLGMKNLEEAFLWGLMHDLGKLVLYKYLMNEYAAVASLVNEKEILIRQAEKSVLGIDHTTVGYHVGKNWNLPPALLKVIRYHHHPGRAMASKRIVAIVHVADAICRALGLGNAGDAKVPPIDSGCWELLNMNKQAAREIFARTEQDLVKANAMLAFI